MFFSPAKRLFGQTSTPAKKSRPQYGRKLRVESLESRLMLSVGPMIMDDETPDTVVVAAAADKILYNRAEWNLVESLGVGSYVLNVDFPGRDEVDNYALWEEIGGEMRLIELNCDNLSLTSLDVSGCTELRGLWCNDNQLIELKVTGCTALETLWCEGNKLTFATLPNPAFFADPSNYYYGYQDDIEISATIPRIFSGMKALVAEQGENTEFTWKYNDGAHRYYIVDFTETDGVFTFGKSVVGENVYCEMTNPAFPRLVLWTPGTKIVDIVVVIPEVTSVLTTIQPNLTATQMSPHVEKIHEWQRFWLELWADAEVMNGAEFTVTYNADLFVPVGVSGVKLAYEETARDGGLVWLTVTVSGTVGAAEMLGAIEFKPTAGGGVKAADISRGHGWLTVNDADVPTQVWAVPYDLNDDGKVDVNDLIDFIKLYGQSGETVADFDGNNKVDVQDLIEFITHYGMSVHSTGTISIPRMSAFLDSRERNEVKRPDSPAEPVSAASDPVTALRSVPGCHDHQNPQRKQGPPPTDIAFPTPGHTPPNAIHTVMPQPNTHYVYWSAYDPLRAKKRKTLEFLFAEEEDGFIVPLGTEYW